MNIFIQSHMSFQTIELKLEVAYILIIKIINKVIKKASIFLGGK